MMKIGRYIAITIFILSFATSYLLYTEQLKRLESEKRSLSQRYEKVKTLSKDYLNLRDKPIKMNLTQIVQAAANESGLGGRYTVQSIPNRTETVKLDCNKLNNEEIDRVLALLADRSADIALKELSVMKINGTHTANLNLKLGRIGLTGRNGG